jgi:hypothetical protein
VQAQPPTDALEFFPDPGELNTDNCFSTALLSHLGQLTCSRADSTMVSKRCWQRQQLYSNIGMRPHLLTDLDVCF